MYCMLKVKQKSAKIDFTNFVHSIQPSIASQTQPTPAQIVFSACRSDLRWGWLGLTCETNPTAQLTEGYTGTLIVPLTME